MAEGELQASVKKFAGDLAGKIKSFIEDVTVLEVRTYTIAADQAPQLINNRPDFGQIATQGAVVLRAYTQVSFDGDTTVCVPVDAAGAVDTTLWALHQQTLAQATANRNAMIEAIGKAAAAALQALKATQE